MAADFTHVQNCFSRMQHVSVGARSRAWRNRFGRRLARLEGDRDIIAVNEEVRDLLMVEVEGDSSGQPETKVYKAVGQAVAATSMILPADFSCTIGVVVVGKKLRDHLARCAKLVNLGIFGMCIDRIAARDEVRFGKPPWV